jgi:hypothetical protein
MLFQKYIPILMVLFLSTSQALFTNGIKAENIFSEAYLYEDFTTFTARTRADVISVNQSHVSWDHMDRTFECNVSKSYGPGHFGDFEHKFEFEFHSIEAGDENERQILILWQLSVETGFRPENMMLLYPFQLDSIDDRFRICFWQRSEGNRQFVFIGDYVFSTRKTYYVTISRKGEICRAWIFGNADRTNLLVDSGDWLGVTTKYEYIAIPRGRGIENDPDDWSTGYLANLVLEDFQKKDTLLSFTLDPNPAQLGDNIKMTGNLTDEDGDPMESSPVSVYYSIDDGVSWIYAGTIWTNSTGWFTAKGKITIVGYYFVAVVYRGTPEYTLSYDIEKLIINLP